MHSVIETNDSAFSQYWDRLYRNDPLQHPLYAQQNHRAMGQVPAEPQFTNRSFLVVSEDEPVFGCSLTMHTDEQGRKCMGYFGMEASTHVNRTSMQQSSNNFRPEAIRVLQQHINRLIDEIQPDSLDYLDPVSCGIMSPVTEVLLEKGATPTVQKAQVIDLSLSQHSLSHNLRKSYRSYINWGRRNLAIEVISGSEFSAENSQLMRTLHRDKIARGNSGISNWNAFEELIRRGNAFLVQGSFSGELVASTLFVNTDKTCHYVLGDIQPQSPDRPFLHALVWEGILHSKRKGCSQFSLGRSPMAKSDESLAEILSAGFGGESHTRLKVSLVQ